ncbi:MAG: substrate-binding domain-containing protein [Pseudomonadota bacterium]|nr:substrate-binding domain-containing protein [Pseudomonadota bacterium]
MIRYLLITALITLGFSNPVHSIEKYITLVGTTSTESSGLYDKILPIFEEKTGIQVRVISVGTGRAINIAKKGDADVLLVHHRKSEEEFITKGFGVKRYDVMYNDFIIVGPKSDPANISNLKDVVEGLTRIASTKNLFVSRGDNSGTHKKELEIWELAGIDVSKNNGIWYRESGSGMGTTLNITAAIPAYTICDRGTWLNFKNRGDLQLLLEKDVILANPYGVILVNPKLHPHIKAEMGQTFIDWIIGKDGQIAISSFRVNGKQGFFPNAKK